MGRIPCCEKENVKRGQWTPEEDNKLASYIAQHGTRNWRLIPKNAGLQRCGKSCRLRWTNYLRPDLKHGQFSKAEEHMIVKFHSVLGKRWSLTIAAQLPGRTDNDVKNYWNTKLKKKLSGMGKDPVTHKPFSHLMAEITTTLNPPQVSHLTVAAVGVVGPLLGLLSFSLVATVTLFLIASPLMLIFAPVLTVTVAVIGVAMVGPNFLNLIVQNIQGPPTFKEKMKFQ